MAIINHFCSCGNPAYVFGFVLGVKTTVCREHIYTLTDKRVAVFDIAAFGFIETREDGPLYERRREQALQGLGSLSALESMCERELAAAQSRLEASKTAVHVVVEESFTDMQARTVQRYVEVRTQLAQAKASVERLLTSKDSCLSPSVSALCVHTAPLFRLVLGNCALPVAQTLLGHFYLLPEGSASLVDFAQAQAEKGRVDVADEAINYAKTLESGGHYPDYSAAAASYQERSSQELLFLLLNAATDQDMVEATKQEHFLQLHPGDPAPMESDLQLSAKCGLSQLRVSAQQVDEAPCLVSISAGGQPDSGVCLVCVLDYSSLESDFGTVKAVLLGLVESLGPRDAMALVRFSHYAEQLSPLATDKAQLRSLVQSLDIPQASQLAKAFLLGLNMLRQKSPHQRAQFLLFSDEQPTSLAVMTSQAALQHCGMRLPVHCWSSVKVQDTELLQALAAHSGGTFSYLASPEQVAEVCTLAFGSDRSVVASDLQVSLEVKPGPVRCDLVKVYSENSNSLVSIQELRRNEVHDLVFLVRPKYQPLAQSVRLPTVLISLKYRDTEGTETETSVVLDLKFVRWEGPGCSKDANVFAHWYTAWGRDSLQRAHALAVQGQSAQARTVLEHTLEAIQAGGSKEAPMVQAVLRELEASVIA